MHKFIACILLFSTSTLLPMSKFVCCAKVMQEEKQQQPFIIKQVFDFEVRTSTNPNSSIRYMPCNETASPSTFSRVILIMGSTSIKVFSRNMIFAKMPDGPILLSADVIPDSPKSVNLRKYTDVLQDKLREAAGGYYNENKQNDLKNCKGKLTVTCPTECLYSIASVNHTYEIELQETGLKEEEHKSND